MSNQETTSRSLGSHFNTLVAIAIAFIALLGAVITKIQSDAFTISGIAGNDEQDYYYQAMGRQIGGDADTNNEFGTIYQLWSEYNLLAISAEKNGDLLAANSYSALRDELVKDSALLSSEYFDPATGKVDLIAFKNNLYEEDITALQEMQTAAGNVSDAWGEKANTYVLQMTLLAVAGFLLGLALMTSSPIARMVFTVSGIPLMFIISIWAYVIWRQPVYDLRETGAIPHYAAASSFAEQKQWKEALAALDQAIALAGAEHPYGRAYLLRSEININLRDFPAAISDYEAALNAGEDDPNVLSGLVWALFQSGEFGQAVEAGRQALEENPDDIWLQLRVGIALLAAGETEAAQQQYQSAIELATAQVNAQRALGADPSDTWWQLNEAAYQLETLSLLVNSKNSNSPVKAAITKPDVVGPAALDLSAMLNAASMSLQYGVDAADVKAVVGSPEFSFSTIKEKAFVRDVRVTFSYSGLEKGQLLVVKVFRNGIEDPSWMHTQVWDQSKSGNFSRVLTPSYSDLYLVPSGSYKVNIYVNGKLLQTGGFTVGGQDVASTADTTDTGSTDFVFSSMLDEYDFSNLGIFDSQGDSAQENSYSSTDDYSNLDTYYDVVLDSDFNPEENLSDASSDQSSSDSDTNTVGDDTATDGSTDAVGDGSSSDGSSSDSGSADSSSSDGSSTDSGSTDGGSIDGGDGG